MAKNINRDPKELENGSGSENRGPEGGPKMGPFWDPFSKSGGVLVTPYLWVFSKMTHFLDIF